MPHRRGTVAWFDAAKGFGFLMPDTGPPAVFVDHRVIEVPGFKTLVAGQSLAFSATDTPRGPEATRVVPDTANPFVSVMSNREEPIVSSTPSRPALLTESSA